MLSFPELGPKPLIFIASYTVQLQFLLTLINLSGACFLLILLRIWRNLVKLSFTSLLSNSAVELASLNVSQKAVLSNVLKSLVSLVSGKGLHNRWGKPSFLSVPPNISNAVENNALRKLFLKCTSVDLDSPQQHKTVLSFSEYVFWVFEDLPFYN